MGGDGAIPFDERLGTGHWLHARGVEQARPAIVLPRYQVRQNHGGGGAVADAPGSEASRDKIPFSTRRRPTDERRAIKSEEHTSELQSLMRISYAVFCLKNKKKKK